VPLDAARARRGADRTITPQSHGPSLAGVARPGSSGNGCLPGPDARERGVTNHTASAAWPPALARQSLWQRNVRCRPSPAHAPCDPATAAPGAMARWQHRAALPIWSTSRIASDRAVVRSVPRAVAQGFSLLGLTRHDGFSVN